MNDTTDQTVNNSYVDDYLPPSAQAPAAVSDSTASSSDEDLESMNIFFMLGAEDGTDEQKEKFLDELQQVIWDDFLSNDVKLLITSDETAEFDRLMQVKNSAQTTDQTESAQDSLVEYLEKLIPDLEDIMLEKALDLKADLFTERIASLKEYNVNNADKLEEIKKAEALMFEDKWKSATLVLNQIEA